MTGDERTVQVPVSLIERAKSALLEVPPSSRNAGIYAELDTALLEPTLTREQVQKHRLRGASGIDAMRPGTEFLCEGKGVPGVEHHMRVTDDVHRDGARILWCLTHESGAAAWYVDPSTIRDVAPPAVTS